MRRCLTCHILIRFGSRCPLCQRHEHDRRSLVSTPAYGGSGWAWQRLRDQVLARDGGCTMAVNGHCAGPLRVDHITPASLGGTATLANLRTLCLTHHRALPTTRGGG